MTTQSGKVKSTRFLIISDTHNTPIFPSDSKRYALRKPLRQADVLLHCGDLTNSGGMHRYEAVLKMLESIDAELKLVIAGNHDITLDKPYWHSHRDRFPARRPDEYEEATALWKGQRAKEAGVTFLDEGTHKFALKSGVSFTVYASPYTPEFCDWAFAYELNEDRYNSKADTDPSAVCIAENPIPSFPAVDIVMTHGPPKRRLDQCSGGNVGCPHLLRALQRVRPRLHCFGHIHEGYGAELVRWSDESEHQAWQNDQDSADGLREVVKLKWLRDDFLANRCTYVNAVEGEHAVDFGKSTLMVNAAIMTGMFLPLNAPVLVDLDLPLQ